MIVALVLMVIFSIFGFLVKNKQNHRCRWGLNKSWEDWDMWDPKDVTFCEEYKCRKCGKLKVKRWQI